MRYRRPDIRIEISMARPSEAMTLLGAGVALALAACTASGQPFASRMDAGSREISGRYTASQAHVSGPVTSVYGSCYLTGDRIGLDIELTPPSIASRPAMPCSVSSDEDTITVSCREWVKIPSDLAPLNHWDSITVTVSTYRDNSGSVAWVKDGWGEWGCLMLFRLDEVVWQ